METQLTDFYEDLSLLSDCLGEGIEKEWSHELRKEILLLLHKLKNNSRRLANFDIESELIAIEVTLGYGSGSTINEIEASQIEEHQLRLIELTDQNAEISDEVVLEESVDEPLDELKEQNKNITDESSVELKTEVKMEESSKPKLQLILCNCPGRDAARELAHGLIKARLAACVNVIANIGSIYWWQGEIKDTAECQLQIKTSNQSFDDVIQYIKQNHPNDVPEILGVPVDKGNEDYFDWVKQETYDRE